MSNLKMRLEMNSTNENAIKLTPFYVFIFIYKNVVSLNYNIILKQIGFTIILLVQINCQPDDDYSIILYLSL